MTELSKIAIAARAHADALEADIHNASTRIEHLRLTILASEADRVATDLENLLRSAA